MELGNSVAETEAEAGETLTFDPTDKDEVGRIIDSLATEIAEQIKADLEKAAEESKGKGDEAMGWWKEMVLQKTGSLFPLKVAPYDRVGRRGQFLQEIVTKHSPRNEEREIASPSQD